MALKPRTNPANVAPRLSLPQGRSGSAVTLIQRPSAAMALPNQPQAAKQPSSKIYPTALNRQPQPAKPPLADPRSLRGPGQPGEAIAPTRSGS